MQILPVTPDDKKAIIDLFRADAEAKKIWPSGIGMNWYFYWTRRDEGKDNAHWVKAVDDNGRILGSVSWTVRKRDGGRTLHDITVHPDARGTGLGRLLVEHIGLPISLKTDHDSLANGFYRKLGFKFDGTSVSRNGLKTFHLYTKE